MKSTSEAEKVFRIVFYAYLVGAIIYAAAVKWLIF
jgi:hypothetical protein